MKDNCANPLIGAPIYTKQVLIMTFRTRGNMMEVTALVVGTPIFDEDTGIYDT